MSATELTAHTLQAHRVKQDIFASMSSEGMIQRVHTRPLVHKTSVTAAPSFENSPRHFV
ncbi:hypothetical protein BDR06DRAFT_962321 [Suillus hirtellus]|nr:hypothetical protein BDR06DRAFT_965440 [Suillus hirtellus]KAG2046169.1 hypothetical protein BDR06DRAFT_965364 [Suillus hirtellus]KAG2048733.1 hypothetical protein BDR06DRAFT_962321 [Suillus hirtellus]